MSEAAEAKIMISTKAIFENTRLKDPLRGSKPYGTETQIGTDAQNGTETQSGTDAHFSKGTYAHLLTKKKFSLIKIYL